MRKLHFVYETRLSFDGDINSHSFALRCIPQHTASQYINKLSCQITPMSSVTKTLDAFNNVLIFGYIPEEHREFGFKVEGTVTTDSENINLGAVNPAYRYATKQTTLDHGTEPYFEAAGAKVDPIQKTLAMARLLYRNFVYKPCSTNTKTTAQQALDQGCGVCQDYSHILIALCRQLGIPSRYICGFMMGEGATHAWVEVYARGHWVGIDPTNDRLVDDQYIRISEGRDAQDVIIDKGVFFGVGNQSQTVMVKAWEEPLK